MWEHGLSISDLSGEDEQRTLLEASHAAGVESDAILSALDSRFSSVRDEAGRLRAQLDDRGRADMRRTLLLLLGGLDVRRIRGRGFCAQALQFRHVILEII